MDRNKITLGALVVSHGRSGWLERCLNSLVSAATQCHDISLRILVLINGSDAASVRVVRNLANERGSIPIELIEQELQTTPAKARNQALESLKPTTWIFFIDDDAFVEADFFSLFVDAAKRHPKAVAIGGPNLTPQGSTVFQTATGCALSSRFATFLSVARYRPSPLNPSCGEESLILCNLFVRTSTLGEKPFPETFVCAEENRMLKDLSERGHQLAYVPQLSVWHERRPTLKALIGQVFNYGRGRAQLIRAYPSTIRVAHVLPSVCVACLGVGLSLSICGSAVSMTFTALLVSVYLILACISGARAALKQRTGLAVALLAISLFPVIHLAYGSGVIQGLLRRGFDER